MGWFDSIGAAAKAAAGVQTGSLGALGGGNAFDQYKPYPLPDPSQVIYHAGGPLEQGPWATTDQGMPGGENGRGPGGPFYQPPIFNRGGGQPLNQPMGSLQSLGMGGSPSLSGSSVMLRGPDGSTQAVPQSDLAHWLSKGATMAMGG